MKCSKIGNILIGSALFFGATASQAAFTSYFGENLNPGFAVSGAPVTARTNFLNSLSGGVGNEDFENIGLGTGTPLALSFPGSTGNITATLNGTGVVENDAGGAGSGGNPFGRFNTTGGGSQFWEASSSFSITFSSAISAFGFYATDIGDFNGQVTLTTAGGLVQVLNVGNTIGAPNGSLLFYGFTDTTYAYTSITFGNTASGVDFFGFDDMVIGDLGQINAPEPTILGLLAIGLIGTGFASRRRKA